MPACRRRICASADEAPIRDLLGRRRHAEAFELLVRTYRDKVYRLAYSILGNEALAEESAQDAFLRAWRGLDEFRGQSALGTWLYAIARNTSLTALERSRTRRYAPLTDASAIAAPAPRDIGDVASLVEALPDKYRSVVRLFYIEERSYEEVSAMLDLPLGTVKTYLHRARKELAQSLLGARMREREGR